MTLGRDPRTLGHFAGVLAATGTARAECWRFVACPRAKCNAGRGVRCRRWIAERHHSGSAQGGRERIFQGEGRWESIKHPHEERKTLAKQVLGLKKMT